MTDEEDEEGFDEDELQMYEQFLANQQQEQQNLAHESAPGAQEEEEEYGDEDFEGYPPELVEAARQMGLGPEQIKELQK